MLAGRARVPHQMVCVILELGALRPGATTLAGSQAIPLMGTRVRLKSRSTLALPHWGIFRRAYLLHSRPRCRTMESERLRRDLAVGCVSPPDVSTGQRRTVCTHSPGCRSGRCGRLYEGRRPQSCLTEVSSSRGPPSLACADHGVVAGNLRRRAFTCDGRFRGVLDDAPVITSRVRICVLELDWRYLRSRGSRYR